jgi:hypothetical protein
MYVVQHTTIQHLSNLILCCSSAVGQINAIPGLWQPEWVPAQFIVYHPPMRGATIVFLDEGEPCAHAIDLQGELSTWTVCLAFIMTTGNASLQDYPS